jgi:hypothetical protein
MDFPLAKYPVEKGYVVWKPFDPDQICRQRMVGAIAFVRQVQCFRPEAQELASPTKAANLGDAYEYPSTADWTALVFKRTADHPVEGRLLPVSD